MLIERFGVGGGVIAKRRMEDDLLSLQQVSVMMHFCNTSSLKGIKGVRDYQKLFCINITYICKNILGNVANNIDVN